MINTAATMTMITRTPADTPPTIAATELLASSSTVVNIMKVNKLHHVYS